MNIRFVNNLTQHVKSFSIVTKINQLHLYQICSKFLLNKNYPKRARNYRPAASTIETILTIANPNNSNNNNNNTNATTSTTPPLNIQNILEFVTTTETTTPASTDNSSIKNQYNTKGEVPHICDNSYNKQYLYNDFPYNEKSSLLHLCETDDRTLKKPSNITTNWYRKNHHHQNTKHEDDKVNGYYMPGDESRSYGKGNSNRSSCPLFITAFTFSFFGWESDEANEDDPSEKLIMQIKRSMLCIQREQYDKAEQMLHLALRMAQDLQNSEGITYIYDLMANLAMEREQYPKAEKLFADVMKRLFSEGHGEESPQILHISSKLAHMAQLQGDLEKAYQGFTWTLERIARSIQNTPDDKDLQELFGLTKNWFGQLLMKQGKYMEAKKHFEAAHQVLTEVYGNVNEAAVTILNNLSTACFNLDDYAGAKSYLNKAIDLVKELKDSTQEGILYANLGLIYLREGLTLKAKESCSLAYRIGKKQNNPDAVEQAEYCLSEVKSSL